MLVFLMGLIEVAFGNKVDALRLLASRRGRQWVSSNPTVAEAVLFVQRNSFRRLISELAQAGKQIPTRLPPPSFPYDAIGLPPRLLHCDAERDYWVGLVEAAFQNREVGNFRKDAGKSPD